MNCHAVTYGSISSFLFEIWAEVAKVEHKFMQRCCVSHHRLLEEEAAKRAQLERIHLQQQRALFQTEAEKQELVAEQLAKERALQAAMLQLERHGALEQYEVRSHMSRLTLKTPAENLFI